MDRLPPPPKALPGLDDGDVRALAAGTLLWRIYFRGGEHPGEWDRFRTFGPTTSRFDHHTRPKREQRRGIVYAAHGPSAVLTALAETFQHTRVVDRVRREPWLAGFALAQDVTLLDTGGWWPLRAGGNMAINSGSRAMAREWSRAIYRNYTDVAGICYPSSLANEPAVALYERAEEALPDRPMFNESLASPKLLAGLSELADAIRYGLK